jgi:inner membrane protein
MDTVTHIVLGACIGELMAGKESGKKALLIGAVAQSLPDIDFVASFWLPTTEDLLAHRGFTHSFLFILLTAPLLGWLSSRLFRRDGTKWQRWSVFWGLQMFVHILLDSFNAYGTGWFIPFSSYRVAFHTMYVADPLFSIWLAIAFVALVVLKRSDVHRRRQWAKGALICSVAYLLVGIGFKLYIEGAVRRNLEKKKITSSRFFTTPTPLTNLLWYIVAEDDSGYHIGYRSVLDKTDTIRFRYVKRHDELLKLSDNEHDEILLLRFSQGYYTMLQHHDTLLFNVLRFGDMSGWSTLDPGFAFYYYLQHPEENKLIVQRGRVAMWSRKSLEAYVKRIKGI